MALAARTRNEAASQLLGRRCLRFFSQRRLLLSAGSRTHHILPGSGAQDNQGDTSWAERELWAGEPWEEALREDGDSSWLLPTHLLCVSHRGGLGADGTSPACKEGAGSSGSTGAGSLGSSMASPRGRGQEGQSTWTVAWMTAPASHRAAGLLRHTDTGTGSREPPGRHLSDKALCTALHLLPRCFTGPGGQIRVHERGRPGGFGVSSSTPWV